MANLQTTINGLPKYLSQNVTIRVSPGTLSAAIYVSNFSGTGSLIIQAIDAGGANVTAIATTHNTSVGFIATGNTCTSISVRGFNCTATAATAFSLDHNNCEVEIMYCQATAGANSNANNRGVLVDRNSGNVRINICQFSNKNIAIQAASSVPVHTSQLTGTGNLNVYQAQWGGIITATADSTITGTNQMVMSNGGIINNRPTATRLRDRPDSWTPNTEIDLGGGEFGHLISRTITVAPNTHSEQSFIVPVPITRIVDVGGEWEFSTGTFMTYGGISTGSARISANVSREINRIIFYSYSDAQRTNASIWIWVIYRK
jgi:hypothetical protein